MKNKKNVSAQCQHTVRPSDYTLTLNPDFSFQSPQTGKRSHKFSVFLRHLAFELETRTGQTDVQIDRLDKRPQNKFVALNVL